MEEQCERLQYDPSQWEFPREHLKLGIVDKKKYGCSICNLTHNHYVAFIYCYYIYFIYIVLIKTQVQSASQRK